MNLGNVIILGGTGMLARASGWISTHAENTIIYGRDKRRLKQIENMYDEHGLFTRELDYTKTSSLIKEISDAHRQYGSINLIVAWIHSTAPNAIPTIIKEVSKFQQQERWSLLIIKGSSSDLSSIIKTENIIPRNCDLKEVQLGFYYDGLTSRWLTHEEISNGIIEVIKYDLKRKVVGTLEPWDKRP
ncbi:MULTISPECIES: short-chain dehydrogenase [Bacillaceae]|uniref:Short-chain dehydrogenase n=1 Tax=Evansella alkalicola TaxID=745819 RepID=A0ABS6JS94_9BACI|nr:MULTISPECIES: short-chain dehydrogenase [Bacillaceae]MBU9721436.1 short-chain dehydrogenase [Bacillus alkalicola]